ncbi:MAG TPA: histidine--tRNA ligase [Candidatus Acidoferrum sp.]|nr:histidine--tRNA ligase [Candidatus Acidoferrum sp.]
MPEFKTVRGMRDFLPEETRMMKYIENKARSVAESFGYQEIMTPIVESYELLATKAGEEVRLRMFAFKDLGGRMVALRPEFTPSIARVVATTLKNEPKPLRLFSVGSLYRYDEPQRGRYREFWQSDFELVGSSRPEADAEVLMVTARLMERVGLKDYIFKVGHVGVLRGVLIDEGLNEKAQNAVLQLMDKKQYEDSLVRLKDSGASEKCLTVSRGLIGLRGSNISETVEKMKTCVDGYEKAVAAVEDLKEILKLVVDSGCKITVNVEAGFARGLEYYTGMIFEVYVPQLDVALTGGGRYDKLVELFGGQPTPAVGVANGVDRMMLAMQEQKVTLKGTAEKKVIVISAGDETKSEALRISHLLKDAGITVELEVMGRKMGKALEDADRRKLDYAVIVGKKEFDEGKIVLKDLKRRKQTTVRIEELQETLKS